MLIELDPQKIRWPERCCRCGSTHYEIRSHTEDVVVWTILSVTASKRISLQIPVCNRCFFANYLWYGAAVLTGGTAYWLLDRLPNQNDIPTYILVMIFGAIGLGIVGTRKQPIKIMKLDEKQGRISLEIYHPEVAKQLMQNQNEVPK